MQHMQNDTDKKNEVLKEKPVSEPLCLAQILHELVWDWAQNIHHERSVTNCMRYRIIPEYIITSKMFKSQKIKILNKCQGFCKIPPLRVFWLDYLLHFPICFIAWYHFQAYHTHMLILLSVCSQTWSIKIYRNCMIRNYWLGTVFMKLLKLMKFFWYRKLSLKAVNSLGLLTTTISLAYWKLSIIRRYQKFSAVKRFYCKYISAHFLPLQFILVEVLVQYVFSYFCIQIHIWHISLVGDE